MHFLIEALRGQFSRSWARLLVASALFVSGVPGAWADAIEDLQGAWVMEDTKCAAVFEKIRGKIQFKDRTFAPEHGFIISAERRWARLQVAKSPKSTRRTTASLLNYTAPTRL